MVQNVQKGASEKYISSLSSLPQGQLCVFSRRYFMHIWASSKYHILPSFLHMIALYHGWFAFSYIHIYYPTPPKPLFIYRLLDSCPFNRESPWISPSVLPHFPLIIGLARQPSAQNTRSHLNLSVSQWPSGLLREPPTRPRLALASATCWGTTWRGGLASTPPGPWNFQMGPALPGTSSPSLASMEWSSSSDWPATSSERMINPWKICTTPIWPPNSKRKVSKARWQNALHWPLATQLSCSPTRPAWGQNIKTVSAKLKSKGSLESQGKLTSTEEAQASYKGKQIWVYLGPWEKSRVLGWGWKNIPGALKPMGVWPKASVLFPSQVLWHFETEQQGQQLPVIPFTGKACVPGKDLEHPLLSENLGDSWGYTCK